MAAGMALSAAPTLSAQTFQDRHDLRNEFRPTRRDQLRIDRLRAEIALDQARLNEAIRRGRTWQASRLAAQLARNQQALRLELRDVRYDRADGRDYRDNRYGNR